MTTSSHATSPAAFDAANHCYHCGAHLSEPCAPGCPLAEDEVVEVATEQPARDWTGVACTICGEDLGRDDHTNGCPDRGRFNNQH